LPSQDIVSILVQLVCTLTDNGYNFVYADSSTCLSELHIEARKIKGLIKLSVWL